MGSVDPRTQAIADKIKAKHDAKLAQAADSGELKPHKSRYRDSERKTIDWRVYDEKIREMWSQGISIREMAETLGIKKSTLGNRIAGRNCYESMNLPDRDKKPRPVKYGRVQKGAPVKETVCPFIFNQCIEKACELWVGECSVTRIARNMPNKMYWEPPVISLTPEMVQNLYDETVNKPMPIQRAPETFISLHDIQAVFPEVTTMPELIIELNKIVGHEMWKVPKEGDTK